MTQMASLRGEQLDHGRIVGHLRGVEADFARAVTDHLVQREAPSTTDEHLAVAVTARTLAAATFAAMETWMVHGEPLDGRALPPLPRWRSASSPRRRSS